MLIHLIKIISSINQMLHLYYQQGAFAHKFGDVICLKIFIIQESNIQESKSQESKIQDSRFKIQDSKFKIQNYFFFLQDIGTLLL